MTTTAAPPRPSSTPAILRPGTPLSVIVALACTCGFMAVMDSSIVNVALPTIRGSLHLSASAYQWVVNAYLLTLGGFLLLAARANDLFGRKRVLQIGIAVFTLASLVGGLADSGVMLIAARAVQGLGGAVLAPAGLGLILSTHAPGPAKTRAMSIYAATASIAATGGVLLGGILTQWTTWRWVMFVNVPVGVALFAAVAVTLLSTPADGGARRLDVPGALTIVTGMGALIYGLSVAPEDGWGSTHVVISLIAAVLLISAFIAVEQRVTQPLVHLSVFRIRNLTIGNLVLGGLGVALTGSAYFVSIILQQDLGYSALRTGLAMSPMGVALAMTSLSAPRLIRRVAPRYVAAAGGLIGAAGFAWLAAMPDHPHYAADMLGPLIVFGAGLGLMLMPSSNAATAGLAPREAGMAAGLFNMSRQLGAAIGLAALATLSTAVSRHAASGHSAMVAALDGNRVALFAAAGVICLAALTALFLRQETPAPR